MVAPLSGHSLMQGLASLLLAVTWVLASMAFSSPTLGSTSLSSRGGVADKRGLQIKVSLILYPQLGRQGGVRDLSCSVTNCTSSFFHPLHGVGGKQIISRKSSADNLTSGGRSWLCYDLDQFWWKGNCSLSNSFFHKQLVLSSSCHRDVIMISFMPK